MAEEKIEQPQEDPDMETMDAFRYVLHTVKGISPVSAVPELAVYNEDDAE